ncbi:PepSY domain-containing protein [Sphingomonas sp. BGYR3]|uniref:PepSY-associated TM helix domain-containing protein n=1 Tax=Sphingomonas sp. BGYR3 TaxID=2975483 RepID=UPI0021A9445F|nr:PepSY domain-containing protein [Sphingomonas sp. BGYR3]MDG5488997.1 PepSY domain-containing protein [Sphingomonas sp. BGYR3]
MGAGLYRTIWRWHFYAGLFVVPFILMLSVTGAVFLFKPQLDRWQEREWLAMPVPQTASPDDQARAALAANPGARIRHYRLPQAPGDAAMIQLDLPGGGIRNVYVAPDGRVAGAMAPADRISAIVSRIHGTLMIGTGGRLLVELAGSWAIVMVLTGLYLWWPRGRGAAGVVWPRLHLGGRTLLRDLHAVTGFWVAGLALILLFTALPWTEAWATAFRAVRAEMGWVKQAQQWEGGDDLHGDHDHEAMLRAAAAPAKAPVEQQSLTAIVARARGEGMPHPAILLPPNAPMRFGPPNGPNWRLTSETQDRPEIRTVEYDAATGTAVARSSFADQHPIDRAVSIGIAWHEGQWLGWINQAIGVLTALALIVLAVSGTLMWWRRRPTGQLGAPPAPRNPVRMRGVAVITLVLAIFLPLLGASLVVLAVIDRLALPLWRRARIA